MHLLARQNVSRLLLNDVQRTAIDHWQLNIHTFGYVNMIYVNVTRRGKNTQ